MIQLTWLELLFIFFSALVGGSVLFSFKFRKPPFIESVSEAQDEVFIDAEAQRRLRQYDLNEEPVQVQTTFDNEFTELRNRIQHLEEQIKQLKAHRSEEYPLIIEDTPTLAEADNYQAEDKEPSEEDQYLQAREEMELALFKAQRQLTRYEKILQDQSPLSSEEAVINQAENPFKTEFTKSAQVIEQLRVSFQKNPHTAFSLRQLKQRIDEEMETLSAAAEPLQPVKI